MASGLNLSSRVEVFPCPNCGQTINTSVASCPFCSTPIDHAAAEAAAAETSRISQACSDASYLKIMAWTLLTFFVIRFVPFLYFAGFLGLWFLRIAIPVMLIRWWVKFGGIKTTDADFGRAKRAAIVVSVVAVLALASALYR
jgi:endogenous inhibitor of DNA gyrase (YacG/DUF329 family)